MNHDKRIYFDEEEKELIEIFEKIPLHLAKRATPEQSAMLRASAAMWIRKNSKMNIRITPGELQEIKAKAAEAGLAYQPFVRSILHKYITGQLVEVPVKAKKKRAIPKPRAKRAS